MLGVTRRTFIQTFAASPICKGTFCGDLYGKAAAGPSFGTMAYDGYVICILDFQLDPNSQRLKELHVALSAAVQVQPKNWDRSSDTCYNLHITSTNIDSAMHKDGGSVKFTQMNS